MLMFNILSFFSNSGNGYYVVIYYLCVPIKYTFKLLPHTNKIKEVFSELV